jgi:hypothetical protein
MRLFLLAVLLASVGVGACSGGARAPDKPTGPATGEKQPKTKKPPVSAAAGDITFAPCTVTPCMYHAGSRDYHDCLNVQQGKCFQYGKSCIPADRCMVDPQSGAVRACEQPSEGRCLRFGAACKPAKNCMLEPKERRYRTCEQLTDGKCARFGTPCQPT